ncbi:sugar kinase [Streptomyces sp. RFCAC02]|uniref:sugar kinase n=1 Tax=Streptomyces sp. RFCAC02 TaxID=2499143 RepID=UPI00101ECC50|nr:sugar kinase [Streptomyces sp. RFCAC02]
MTPGSGEAIDLTVLGETMATLTADHIGPLRHARSLGLSVAGSESTVAIGAARLGHRAAWIGRVGDDELGALVTTRLRGEGLHVHAVTDPDAPTGLMLKEQRMAGQSRVHYYRAGSAGSRLEPGDLPHSLLDSTRVLHTTGITAALSPSALAGVEAAVDRVRDAGGIVSFDLNHRARLWSAERAATVLGALVPRVDVLFASTDEAAMLTGRPDATPEENAVSLRRLGPGTVVLTDGAAGALSVTGAGTEHVPALRVTAVDPVGAGDSFVAGYLSGLLAGLPESGRMRRGATVAAACVATQGDWEGLPHLRDLAVASAEPGTVAR